MKKTQLLVILLFLCLCGTAQHYSKTRIVVGLSAPELLHLGLAAQLTPHNLLGVSAGIGPTMGGVWPSLNAEHRLYLGRTQAATQRKQWFFRQGISWFPAGDDRAFTLSVGADLRSKRPGSGWTIDAGILQINAADKGESPLYFPSLRFQYYGLIRKKD